MLHSSLVSEVQMYHNAPILNNRFDSSVPGLYFVGFSFGIELWTALPLCSR